MFVGCCEEAFEFYRTDESHCVTEDTFNASADNAKPKKAFVHRGFHATGFGGAEYGLHANAAANRIVLFGWLRLRTGVFFYYRCADVYFHSFVRACLSIFACLS